MYLTYLLKMSGNANAMPSGYLFRFAARRWMGRTFPRDALSSPGPSGDCPRTALNYNAYRWSKRTMAPLKASTRRDLSCCYIPGWMDPSNFR